MKKVKFTSRLVSLLSLILILGLTASCKKKTPTSGDYMKAIEEMAAKYKEECPKDISNGTRLESVTFSLEDSTLTYNYSLSDNAIISVNVNDSNTREKIIEELSDKLKKYLVMGKCKLKYKYVSPHDSSFIEIIPDELDKILPQSSD